MATVGLILGAMAGESLGEVVGLIAGEALGEGEAAVGAMPGESLGEVVVAPPAGAGTGA